MCVGFFSVVLPRSMQFTIATYTLYICIVKYMYTALLHMCTFECLGAMDTSCNEAVAWPSFGGKSCVHIVL